MHEVGTIAIDNPTEWPCVWAVDLCKVCHVPVPCENGCTDRRPVWDGDEGLKHMLDWGNFVHCSGGTEAYLSGQLASFSALMLLVGSSGL